MTTPLLTTKLYIPPVRPELVSRPRLIRQLNMGLRQSGGFTRKLTLISAGAGFGKTTLLSDWVRRIEQPVAWLSLDQGDNDPRRFWRYVIAALQTVEGAIGEIAQAALQSSGFADADTLPPLDTLVTALINDVAELPEPLVLVLDDYHVIKTEPIHNSLNFLLEHLPSQMHLVLTTRADPPLCLSRRRGRLELTEIRAADLHFTTKEAAELLNTCMDLDLSAQDVAELKNRTEGWIVGLQMAALSLQGRADKHDFVTAFAGDDRYIVDYLVEEVLRRQPSHIETFLLQTSILARLCGSLCDAVTEGENGQALLDHLEQSNVFITPLDNRRHWYRYHHLFADLLRKRLRQSVGAQCLALLHLRASRWYEHEGFFAEAVSHALAAPDLEHAAALIEQHAPDIASHGEIVLARSWLESLPENVIRSSPFLCLLRSSYEESIELVEQWLQNAERAWTTRSSRMDEQGVSDRVAQVRFSGWVASARAFLSLQRGDPLQEVIEFSRQALEHIPEDDLLYNLRARSNLFMTLGCAYWDIEDEKAANQAFAEARRIGEAIEHYSTSIRAARNQARIAYDRGQLHRATAICQAVLQSVIEPSEQVGRPLPVAGRLYMLLGSILLEQNDLEGASHALTKGREMIELTQETLARKNGYLALARLKQAQGDVAGAFDLIERVKQLRTEADPEVAALRGQLWLSQAEYDLRHLASVTRLAADANSEAAALRMRFWLSQAERDSHYLAVAARFAEKRQIKLDRKEQSKAEQFALVRLLIAQHRARTPARGQPGLQTLFQFLNRQFEIAEEEERTGRMIEALILQSLALQVQDDDNRALSALQRALTLAEPEGFVRIFVDEGTHMAALLYQAAERGISPEYAGRLLAAFPDAAPRPGDRLHTSEIQSQMVEPLSERESEVLQLIAAGLTNRQIAQKLFLSPNTIRVHASNIYGKLGVHNRTQAVARARRLGIL